MTNTYHAMISYDLTGGPDYEVFNDCLKQENWTPLDPDTTWTQEFLAKNEKEAHKKVLQSVISAGDAYEKKKDEEINAKSLAVSLGLSAPKVYP